MIGNRATRTLFLGAPASLPARSGLSKRPGKDASAPRLSSAANPLYPACRRLLQISVWGCSGVILLAVQATELRGSEAEPARSVPYPAGSHLQLVRKFFTTADGLPADEIRAVVAARDGIVLAATSKGLARLETERWVTQSGPPEVSALHAPTEGPSALAGASNGVWALNNGQWQVEEGSPTSVIAFAADPNGVPWALAPSGVWRREKSWKRIHTIDDDVLAEPHGLLPAGSNEVLVAAETGLFALAGKRRYWLKLEVGPGTLLSSRARAVAWLDSDHFLVATDKGLNLSSSARGWSSFTGKEGLPILDLAHVVVGPDGAVWLGSEQGLIRWKEGRWTYLASKRWLPDDRVLAIAAGADGSVWVGTPKGLAHILHRKLTLEE